MPGGDKTGPRGAGAMTGRGMGLCAGFSTPGYMNPGFNPRSRGNYGYGRGMGRGNRWGFHATGQPGWARGYAYPYPVEYPTAPATAVTSKTIQTEELAYLKEQTKYFKEALNDIESRVNELQQNDEKAGKTKEQKKK